VEHDVLISSIGGFSTPQLPKIKGLEKMEKRAFHSADWPRELSVDKLKGKTVAVVGSGCSG
jgi:4-hydroxyacetophenone monooxygenase